MHQVGERSPEPDCKAVDDGVGGDDSSANEEKRIAERTTQQREVLGSEIEWSKVR